MVRFTEGITEGIAEDIAEPVPLIQSPSSQPADSKRAVLVKSALTSSLSSLAPPKYSTKRPIEGHSVQDRSSLRKKGNKLPYTVDLTELDVKMSEELEEYERRVSRAIAFAAKADAEQKRRLPKRTNLVRAMRRAGNVTGQPAQNVIDSRHVGSGTVAASKWKASESLERQFEAPHSQSGQGPNGLGGSWFNLFTKWVQS